MKSQFLKMKCKGRGGIFSREADLVSLWTVSAVSQPLRKLLKDIKHKHAPVKHSKGGWLRNQI